MQSLVNNHAFVDGNMRVGSALTAVFLFMNGFQLSVPAEVGETFIVETLIGDRADLPTIAQWLQKHSKPRKS
jgi:death on curing protein